MTALAPGARSSEQSAREEVLQLHDVICIILEQLAAIRQPSLKRIERRDGREVAIVDFGWLSARLVCRAWNLAYQKVRPVIFAEQLAAIPYAPAIQYFASYVTGTARLDLDAIFKLSASRPELKSRILDETLTADWSKMASTLNITLGYAASVKFPHMYLTHHGDDVASLAKMALTGISSLPLTNLTHLTLAIPEPPPGSAWKPLSLSQVKTAPVLRHLHLVAITPRRDHYIRTVTIRHVLDVHELKNFLEPFKSLRRLLVHGFVIFDKDYSYAPDTPHSPDDPPLELSADIDVISPSSVDSIDILTAHIHTTGALSIITTVSDDARVHDRVRFLRDIQSMTRNESNALTVYHSSSAVILCFHHLRADGSSDARGLNLLHPDFVREVGLAKDDHWPHRANMHFQSPHAFTIWPIDRRHLKTIVENYARRIKFLDIRRLGSIEEYKTCIPSDGVNLKWEHLSCHGAYTKDWSIRGDHRSTIDAIINVIFNGAPDEEEEEEDAEETVTRLNEIASLGSDAFSDEEYMDVEEEEEEEEEDHTTLPGFMRWLERLIGDGEGEGQHGGGDGVTYAHDAT
ncbi:unnamed protein product [Peniophora sp. CBMAI 1063]|nr:unnamed protein product [Peniophora sp. CBMAI 1063]